MLRYLPSDFRYATTFIFWITIIIYTFFTKYKKYFNNIIIFCSIIGNLIVCKWGNDIFKILEMENVVQHIFPLLIALYHFNAKDKVNIMIIFYLIYISWLKFNDVKPTDVYKDFYKISMIMLLFVGINNLFRIKHLLYI